jgi:hypothetical protein
MRVISVSFDRERNARSVSAGCPAGSDAHDTYASLNYVLWTGTDAFRSHVLACRKSSITVAALQRVGTALRTDAARESFQDGANFRTKKGGACERPMESVLREILSF